MSTTPITTHAPIDAHAVDAVLAYAAAVKVHFDALRAGERSETSIADARFDAMVALFQQRCGRKPTSYAELVEAERAFDIAIDALLASPSRCEH